MQIGIDIGGSHVAVGLLENEKIITKKETDITVKDKETEENIKKVLIEIITRSIDEIVYQNNLGIKRKEAKSLFRIVRKNKRKSLKETFCKEKNVDLIGIAIPGTIKNNKAYRVNNLNIKEFDIIKELKKSYDVPMKIRNDGKCATLCEKKYGNMKDYDDGIFLCVGTGIGSGVILNGELLESSKFVGFELGHIVINKDGLECACGNKGCFETYGSMKKLKKIISDTLDIGELSGQEINSIIEKYVFNGKNKFKITKEEMKEIDDRINALDNKEEKIEKINHIIDEYVDNFCVGLNSLINIFEPEVICFGGSMVYYEKTILKAINNKLKTDLVMFNKTVPKLVIAKYYNQAGIIGSIL